MIIQGFLLGLTQGFVCAGICLPVIGTYILGKEKSDKSSFLILTLFLLGRFSGYMLIAIASTIAGKFLLSSTILKTAFPVAYIVIGIFMVLYGVSRFSNSHFCRKLKSSYNTSSYIFIAGLITGCNICPLKGRSVK